MSNFFDNTEIEIPCEKCKRKTKKTIGWIKSHKDFVCNCGTKIIINASQFKTKIAKVENELQKALKGFCK